MGGLVEPVGGRPASPESAREAFAAGHHVAVLPGGDLEAFKTFRHRNKIVFSGRSGFARVAIEEQVPIVPIVTAGAGESLMVLSSGRRLARAARLDRIARLHALPVTLSLPWVLSIGTVGFLPYLPLPVKLATAVLPPMRPASGEDADGYALRVVETMQTGLDELVAQRQRVSES